MQQSGYSARQVVEHTIEENIVDNIAEPEEESKVASSSDGNEKKKKEAKEEEELIDAEEENLVNDTIASSVGNKNLLMRYRR